MRTLTKPCAPPVVRLDFAKTSEPPTPSSIQAEFDSIEKVLQEIEELSTTLQTRLYPVLRPLAESPVAGSPQPPSSGVPLAERLAGLWIRLSAIRRTIETTLDNLDLA